jgi:hypothetical protein
MYIRYLHKIFTLSVFDTVQGCICNIYKASFSPGSDSRLSPVTSSLHYNDSCHIIYVDTVCVKVNNVQATVSSEF